MEATQNKLGQPIEVTLDGTVYTTNELTGNQDKALAKLLLSENMNFLLEAMLSPEGFVLGSNNEMVKGILKSISSGELFEFLSIILVPKSAPVYREEVAQGLVTKVGDLTNTQIKDIVTNFFTVNLSSVINIRASLSAETEPGTEIQTQ